MRTYAAILSIVWMALAGCGDSSNGGHPPDAADGGADADADAARTEDAPDACADPVFHGASCSIEGSQVCGYQRPCSDVLNPIFVPCTCTSGHYRCPVNCPPCFANQRAGCGIGQTCGSLILTQCDGTTVTINSTCSCNDPSPPLWTCDNGQVILQCIDAGVDAASQAASLAAGP